MATLTGEQKELYLNNLIGSLKTLAAKTCCDKTLDQEVYSLCAPQIIRAADMLGWMRYTDNELDYHKNNGVYPDLNLGNEGNGLPDIQDYRRVLSDHEYADSHLGSVAKLDQLLDTYRSVLFLETLPVDEQIANLSQMRELYRKRKFFETLKEAELLKISSITQNMTIDKLPNPSTEGLEAYRVMFTALDKINNQWLIDILELESEEVVAKRRFLFGREGVVNHLYMEDSTTHISESLTNLLESKFLAGAEHLMWALDKVEGLHPKSVSSLKIDKFYSPLMPGMLDGLSEILGSSPDSYLLLATRDYVKRVSEGMHEVDGAQKEKFSRGETQHDQLMVFPTHLKQSQERLIELARMRPDAHIYEV